MEKTGLAKLLWTYGPTLRWREFRLYGHRPNGKWMPIKLTQIVGGKNWSLSLCRTGPMRGAVRGVLGVEYFCSICSVSEGEYHKSWCHRFGQMMGPDEGRTNAGG